MATACASDPAAALDYAATPTAEKMLRRLRGLVTILFCMVLCGAVGWMVQPANYRATGFLQVAAPTPAATFLDRTRPDNTVTFANEGCD